MARHCIAQAFGAKGNFEGATDVELARRLVGHLTVRFSARVAIFVLSLAFLSIPSRY